MSINVSIDKFGLHIARAVIDGPWLTLLLSTALVVALAPGLGKLGMSSDYREFFGDDNPQLVAFENLEDTYTKLDNILFVIRGNEGRALGPNSYQAIQYLTEEAWLLPTVTRVDSLSNYQHTYVDGDDLLVEDLLGPDGEYSEAELAEKEAIVLAEPALVSNLIAADGGASAVNAVGNPVEEPGKDIFAFVDAGRELAARTEAKFPNVQVEMTGNSMLSHAFNEAGASDSATLIPGMYALLLLALLIVYRSVGATLATFAVVIAASVIALGATGYSGVELTTVSMMAPVVIMTLAVADSVHILVSMLTLMRRGATKLDALRESLRINFLAVAVTSVTTMIGFLCLNFSDSPPFNHLGNITAVGILMAWFYSVVMLPAMLVLLPLNIKTSKSNTLASTEWLGSLAQFCTQNARAIVFGTFVVSIALLSQLSKLELNDSFVEFFDESVEFRRATDFAREHLTGIFTMHFDVSSGEADGINEPEYLLVLDNFTQWLRQQDTVLSASGFTDITKRLNRNMHADDPAYYRIPESRELAAQYLLLYELSLPYGLDLNDRIKLDKSATRVTIILDNPTSAEIREIAARSEQWLRDNAPERMWTNATGSSLLFSHISKRNIDSMITGNLVAIIIIGFLMIIALEHVGLGLLSMLPNVLPVIITLSVWAMFVGVAGMASSVVAASSLGIVVDNTTHFLSKYIRAKRELGKDTALAIRYSFETVGLALVVNAVVLIAGFAVLAYSSFQPNFQMGMLTAMTIAFALIIDLLFLPALLAFRKR